MATQYTPRQFIQRWFAQKQIFIAIESIKENCEIYELNSLQDYRLRTLEQLEIFVISKEEDKELDENFSDLTNNEFISEKNIEILGRKIKPNWPKGRWLSFKEICEGPS